MKLLLPLLVVCSLCHADQPAPQQQPTRLQPPSTALREEDVDYGPLILKNFLGIIPGLFAAAVGHKDGNPELEAAGRTQVVEGFSRFLGALQMLRKPENFMRALEDEELFSACLDEELASEECVRSLRAFKRSLRNEEEQPLSPIAEETSLVA